MSGSQPPTRRLRHDGCHGADGVAQEDRYEGRRRAGGGAAQAPPAAAGPPGLARGAVAPGGRGWWATRAPVRSGNHVEVLVDGAEALAAMEAAIKAARTSVHIAGWHSTPDFGLTATSRRAAAARPARPRWPSASTVRVLLWAGPPLPLFQPTRSAVRASAGGARPRTRAIAVRAGPARAPDALPPREARDRRRRGRVRRRHRPDRAAAATATTRPSTRCAPRSAGTTRRPRCAGRRSPTSPRTSPLRWHEVTGERLRRAGRAAAAPARRRRAGRAHRPREDLRVRCRAASSASSRPTCARCARPRELIYLENQFLWSPEVVESWPTSCAGLRATTSASSSCCPAKPNNGADDTRGQLGVLADADDGAGRFLATTISRTHRAVARPALRARQGRRSSTTGGSRSARRTSTSTRCSTTPR